MPAACVTVKALPAIVAVSERGDVDVFWVHETVVDELPVPLAGDTVTHEPLPDAVQAPP